jgi:Icc-related predicted phosphoesterase
MKNDLKILSTSDIHGDEYQYSLLKKEAQRHQADVVIIAGDLFPKLNPIFKRQPKFIKHLEKEYFPFWEKNKIHLVLYMGNDDLRIYDQMFDDVCSKFEFVHNLPRRKITICGHEVIGFDLVADYPFGLKDRCRMDKLNFVFPIQYGHPAYSTEKANGGGWEDIEDWVSLAQDLPTIEDELKALVRPTNMKKAIYAIHMPPTGVNLDVCSAGDRPGSKAVTEFLVREQPLLSLHGHIHESYYMTGIWKAQIGDTTAIQVGQYGCRLSYAVIDTETMEMHRYEL